jgi:hypothetical protein
MVDGVRLLIIEITFFEIHQSYHDAGAIYSSSQV